MPNTPNPRIFVVDDEEVISMTLAAILRMNGFAVINFTNPLEALLSAHSEHPDLLISDVVMPELSGIELAIQIREVCPTCEILLFSGLAATSDVRRNSRAQDPEFDILAKPIQPSVLICEVRRRVTQQL